MDEITLAMFWNDIPIGKENATYYPTLCDKWGISERQVRSILHELSRFDNGDDYILVRSARGKGFYRTDDSETIKLYRQECLNKGRSIFAPVKKINRVLNANSEQFSMENNLRVFREDARMMQKDVVNLMKKFDSAFDNSLLSKMENGVCMPTHFQLSKLAEIYGCHPWELLPDIYY